MRTIVVLVGTSILLAGCGSDDSGATHESSETPAPTAAEADVVDTIETWLLEPRCDLMTDDFLLQQTSNLEDDPTEACELYTSLFTEKQYGPNDIEVTEVKVTGDTATATVGDDRSTIESAYTLVKTGDTWQIDSSELK